MRSSQVQRAIAVSKKIWYAGRGESVELAGHRLKYIPGTRPVRLKFRDDPDLTVRNDVRQLEYFCENVHAGQTVLDIGANVGQYAVLFGALVGREGRVISFEPEREARALLEENIALNDMTQVRVEPFAVSDTSSERTFYWRSGDQMSSLEREGLGTNSWAADIRTTLVQTVSVDEYLASCGLPDPDWMKIDAEGAEGHILRGASRAMQGNTQILCELHPYAWKGFGTTFDDIASLAANAGRTIQFLDGVRDIANGPDYGAVLISR